MRKRIARTFFEMELKLALSKQEKAFEIKVAHFVDKVKIFTTFFYFHFKIASFSPQQNPLYSEERGLAERRDSSNNFPSWSWGYP